MNKTNRLIRRIKRNQPNKLIYPSIFILLFAIIGIVLLHGSKAAGPYASLEPEGGTVTSGATSVTDNSASNNSYVKFGTESTGGSSNGGCTSGSNPAPCMNGSNNGTGASGWGTPVFDDEFNQGSLKSPWTPGWFGSTGDSGPVNAAENDCYNPSQVSVNSSGLDLGFVSQSISCPGNSDFANPKSYDSGLITSDPFDGTHGSETGISQSTPFAGSSTNTGYTFSYGFVEALIYLPSTTTNTVPGSACSSNNGSIANWPAFWATTSPGITYNEMDILEGLCGQPCYHMHIDSDAPGGCSAGNYTGWHTFAVNWQNTGTATFYYDGVDVGSISNSTQYPDLVSAGPMYLIINNSDGEYGGPTTTPTNMLVRYVRIWQH
jgi:hypothetical protein